MALIDHVEDLVPPEDIDLQSGMAYDLKVDGGSDAAKLRATNFVGRERFGRPFRFVIECRYRTDVVDLEDFVDQTATFTWTPQHPEHADDIEMDARDIKGVISDAVVLGRAGQEYVLRLTLVPKLAMLERSQRCRIFMLDAKQTVPHIIEQVLKDHGFEPGTDFDIGKLDRSRYPVRDYVVQYEESDLDFIHRWMEHEGITYRFEHDGQREKVVFCDSKDHYVDQVGSGHAKVPYHPDAVTGGGTAAGGAIHGNASVFSIGLIRTTIPTHVTTQDYNWRNNTWRDPAGSLLLVEPTSVGSGKPEAPEAEPRLHHEFDTYYDTKEEGQWLIKRRAEGFDARLVTCFASTSCPALAPGHLFQPSGAANSGIPDDSYCVVEAFHVGSLGSDDVSEGREGQYGNYVRCIKADQTFRPERETPWPQVYGVMHAITDGEKCDDNAADDSDEDAYAYAELSPNGEYRVRMPFDLAGRRTGEPASCWIRMAQSNSGKDYGMHFPLHVGTEVLVSHIDGNPDRPIIVGTVPSAHTASPVNQNNSHQNIMRTSSGHQMVMDDMYGSQRIVIENSKSTVFEMYGRDFTAANEFTPNPASMLGTGLGGQLYARADWAGHGGYAPGVSASHNADGGAGFYALGDDGAIAAPEPTATAADHGAAIAAAPAGSAANSAVGRGGAETAEEKLAEYTARSFPSQRFWDHFQKTNTVPHLDLGSNVSTYVYKDFLEVFRIVDREKYLLPPGSLDAKNYEEADEANDDHKNRREVIAEPREKIQYLKPDTTESGDPNLQCYKYTGSIGWQWVNCGPEVGLQYGRVHKRTEGDVFTFHRGDRFHSHEQGDVYEFLHNRNHYVYRTGNDYRIGGGFEHRNTINEDLVEEDFVNNHDVQEVAFTYRLTAATTKHTDLVATATHEQGLSATTSTRFRDVTETDLEIVHANLVQRMIDAKRETRITADDLVHVGGNHEHVVKGKHLVQAANHEIETPGTQQVKSAASKFLFADGFTIKQDSAGAAPEPEAVEGALSSTVDQRLKAAEDMVDDAYKQGEQTTTHEKPASTRTAAEVSPDSASGGGGGISMEAEKIVCKSTSAKITFDASSNFEAKANSTMKLTANSAVQINGSSKVEIKGGQIQIG